MPKMTLLAIAGSSALAGAALTYVLARPKAMLASMSGSREGAGAGGAEGEPGWGSRFNQWRSWCMEHRGQHLRGRHCGPRRAAHLEPTGNAAFDEYRRQTLERLEAEAKEFREYLERLRHARDKGEFDEFMRQRKSGDEAANPA